MTFICGKRWMLSWFQYFIWRQCFPYLNIIWKHGHWYIFLQAASHMTDYIECMRSYCCWQSRKPAWIESIASKGKWSHEVVCVCVCFAGPSQLNWIHCYCLLWVLCGLHNLDRHIDGGLLFHLQSVQVAFISRRAVTRGDGFSRLGVLLEVPTLLFTWSASHDQGLWVLDLFLFSWRSALCGGFFHLWGLGSFHLVLFSSPFVGC
jgi:hypothetical protein